MKLDQASLQNTAAWMEKGYQLPRYDRAAVKERTRKAPEWLHFGAGNIFRAFTAALQQKLLNEGACETGIVVCEGFDTEIIDTAYRPYDNLSLLVVLKCDGTIEKEVVASVVDSLKADAGAPEDWARIVAAFENPSLQMVSFTITEKGYSLTGAGGQLMGAVEQDFIRESEIPASIMGKIAWLCYRRYQAGGHPLALVSMDNCSHNGEKLMGAVVRFAEEWTQRGLVEPGFLAYLKDAGKISFPWSMIDKITPRPDDQVRAMLTEDGFEDTQIIHTAKNTFTAPFVNAEEAQYLVVEDAFPNGRPALEKAGVIFTTRDTVNMVEKMKVCTCLNPLHTALAVYGCILGYRTIFEEMRDPQLKRLIEVIGYEEGMPVVVDPKILNPMNFIREVLEVRLPNPFMPDAPQRIATDTSQKLSIRFGETIKAYQSRGDLDVQSLRLIPLVFAGWLRYLMGVGDDGAPFEISADPMLPELKEQLSGIKLGDKGPFTDKLRPILNNAAIFGVDLYEAGLAQRTEDYFAELAAGVGAVRATLEKYCK